jgi:hypothetical protein
MGSVTGLAFSEEYIFGQCMGIVFKKYHEALNEPRICSNNSGLESQYLVDYHFNHIPLPG